MTATLSLYKLDAELTDLLSYRAERIEDRDSPASAEELEAVDGAIAAYMEQLPRKVDGVASVLRYFDEQVEFADREIKRLRARKTQFEENAQRLKDCAAIVLEKQPMPAKGCRKLVGSHSTLMLKGNGGVQPLVISQPDLIPDNLCRMEGWVNQELWDLAVDMVRTSSTRGTRINDYSLSRVPIPALVREALIQPCATCDGSGEIVNDGPYSACADCSGSGRASVPGAHLEARGFHVEVK